MVLRDILDRKKFQYLRVLNKKADLDRTVFTVESTETPDVAKYIPQNTLLLLTGMAFKDDPILMCSFLEEIDKRMCAGVAIKLGRFIDTLDERILDTADELGIPILQIPMDVTLGTVYQDVLSYIWNNQNNHLLDALNAQQKISNLILQGSSMKSIMNNMAMILHKPVMVMDLFGRILEYGYMYTKTDRETTAEAVGMLLKEKRLEGSNNAVFEKDRKRFCIYPVRGVSRNTNYVIISDFDPNEKEESALIMEQLTMALEMYFYRDLYVKYNEMKVREEYLNFLLEQMGESVWEEKQLLAMGEMHGLKQMGEYKIVILEMEKTERRKFNHVNFSKKEERYILIYDWIMQLLKKETNIVIFPQEAKWRYLCLIQGEEEDYMNIFVHIHNMVESKFGLDVVVAQGGTVASLRNIKNSLAEAEQCLVDGNKDEEYPYLLNYKPKNMMELFKYIPEREMKDICKATLKELAYPDNQMEDELRKTLYTYLSCNSSITKTAEILYLHRNTIKYRLKKCEEILGVDLSDVSNCFQIQLALILTEHAQ